MRTYHVPVLATPLMELLAPQPGHTVLDATVGGGGHAALLAERIAPGGTLIGVDKDEEALAEARDRLRPADVRVVLVHADFRTLRSVLAEAGAAPVHAALLDLGVSSHQLDTPERGFSFRADGPLDMRMNPAEGSPASELVQTLPEAELARILWEYGEEPAARRIARAIVERRCVRPFEATADLASVIERAVGPRRRGDIHPATRAFQALRIAVNDELGALEEALAAMPEVLAPGGVVAVLSYHSLEDRIVKRTFLRWTGRCQCPPRTPECRCGARAVAAVLTRKPIVPGDEEIAANPRARSARLRAARRLEQDGVPRRSPGGG